VVKGDPKINISFFYKVSVKIAAILPRIQEEPAEVNPTKLFFLCFFFFGIKLGHFTINKFFSVCNKNASLPAKNGEILR